MTEQADWRHKLAERLTTPAAMVLAKTGITPNALTVIGFLVSAAAGALIAREYFLAGGLVVLFAGAFDLLDGPVGRATGKTSKFGGFLDSTLDRLSEAVVLAGIVAYYTFVEKATWEPLLAYGCFAGSVMVSYLRARAEGLGIKCEVGIFTRAERVIFMSAGLVFGQWFDLAIPIMLGIITALAFVTVAQRLIHVRRNDTR
ncbi:MAG: CDP-alcohol phosphatidyltransferase family protein [Dehalococcoidia bacterium]|nr:CDP-alcohol phosphatidyltransferase family protein [Dehalococcoidia bacterium]